MKYLQSRIFVIANVCAGAALCALIVTSSLAASQGRKTPPQKRPTASATARPTPAARPNPRAAATPRPTPMAGARDIALLEAALARTLTAAEKTAISAAATTRDHDAKAAVTTFENGVSELFSLSSSELQSRVNNFCRGRRDANRLDLSDILAGVLRRELTDTEIAALAALTEARDAAIELATETYRQSVADALGSTVEEIDAMIQAYLASQSRDNRGPARNRPAKGARADV